MPTAIDLFSGCGGLTLGLQRAGFRVIAAIDSDKLAVSSYRANHKDVTCLQSDIRKINLRKLQATLKVAPGDLDLLAGCPPCQGFSTLRTLNGQKSVEDPLNELIFQFLRFIRAFQPKTIMIENVPGLASDGRLEKFGRRLKSMGYRYAVRVLDACDFGVPQRRRRMILIGSTIGDVKFSGPIKPRRVVRDAIGMLPRPEKSDDPAHNYAVRRAPRVMDLIRHVPKDGGSRAELPEEYRLACHQDFDGFKDVYGRMSWSDPAPTITGGCINPSKGRFLHPDQDRAITLREAALLQGFPAKYHFDLSRGRYPAAQMIGNAFPPKFAEHHAIQIKRLISSA
jgi:DNA (cytosine-5)-methyltransferase 1